MAKVDAKTNIYEITRSTPGSIANLQDLIDNSVQNVFNEYITENGDALKGDKGDSADPCLPCLPIISTVPGPPGENGKDLEIGCNIICYDHSDENIKWSELLIGVRQEWEADIEAQAYASYNAAVTADEAWSKIYENTYAKHGDTEAEAERVLGSYASAVEAYAYDTTLLRATYDGVTATVEEGSKVWAGDATTAMHTYTDDPCPDDGSTPGVREDGKDDELKIGDIARWEVYEESIEGQEPKTTYWYKQYVGTNIVGGCGWVYTSSMVDKAYISYFGTAKSLFIDPETGSITGWEYVGGKGIKSEFVIAADTFKINNPSGDATPFQVDTDTGTATFSGTGGAKFVRYQTTDKLLDGTITLLPSGSWLHGCGHGQPSLALIREKADGTNRKFIDVKYNTLVSSRPTMQVNGSWNTGRTLESYIENAYRFGRNDFAKMLMCSDVNLKKGDMFELTSTGGGSHSWKQLFRYYGKDNDNKDIWKTASKFKIETDDGLNEDEQKDLISDDTKKTKQEAMDAVAVEMGYQNYDDMVSIAKAHGETMIQGGFINTQMIEAQALSIGIERDSSGNITNPGTGMFYSYDEQSYLNVDHIHAGDITAEHIHADTITVDQIHSDSIAKADISSNRNVVFSGASIDRVATITGYGSYDHSGGDVGTITVSINGVVLYKNGSVTDTQTRYFNIAYQENMVANVGKNYYMDVSATGGCVLLTATLGGSAIPTKD